MTYIVRCYFRGKMEFMFLCANRCHDFYPSSVCAATFDAKLVHTKLPLHIPRFAGVSVLFKSSCFAEMNRILDKTARITLCKYSL